MPTYGHRGRTQLSSQASGVLLFRPASRGRSGARRNQLCGGARLDQPPPFGLGHLEMGGPGHAIQLVQVVRHHPQVDQPLAQFGQHVGPSR